jgi:microcin C transport system permease protein
MNFPRKISFLLIIFVVLAVLNEYFKLEFPTVRWIFSFNKNTSHALLISIFIIAIFLLIQSIKFQWNPLTKKRFNKFKSISRGYYSYITLLFLVIIALFDHALVGKKALFVSYNSTWFFPAFKQDHYQGKTFGITSDNINYRELQASWKKEGSNNFVIMPLIPWETTFDTDELQKISLTEKDNVWFEKNHNEPYNGLATSFYSDDESAKFQEATFRQGKIQGTSQYYDRSSNLTIKEKWDMGEKNEQLIINPEKTTEIQTSNKTTFFILKYPPTSPSLERRHFLGTDSRGWDLFAQLYGGFQVVCKACILYILLTFGIGITLGLIMGYFGGIFDLFMQRLIEIISNIPFLFVVMIIASRIGRENIDLTSIVIILCFFSWIGISTYKRTDALREKSRDYISAARVLGAKTPRIIFHHILPNVLSTTVTLIPFSIAGVATSLTALDFIGFGLPDRYPSWGTLLADGLANLESPWIAGSVFIALVVVLLLITFVGEAIHEAFDPKKFTTYQ